MKKPLCLENRMNNISKLITEFDPFKKPYHILVVANISEKINCRKDFVEHSFDGEFFSKAEFAQILSAITSIFGYVHTFFSETEFICYVLENIDILKAESTLVYNFARDGVKEGKKSLIPAFCDLYGLKYTGSNAFVISLLRNKFIFTRLLGACAIPVPHTYKFNARINQFDTQVSGGRYIIKSISQSASHLMSRENIVSAKSPEELHCIVDQYCQKNKLIDVLIQEYIEGIENECEVLVFKTKESFIAMPPIGLKIDGDEILTEDISNDYAYTFFNLQDKYPPSLIEKICKDTEKAASILGIKTYARFDYRIDARGNHYLIDIAGTPYAIEHSSIAYLFKEILHMNYNDFFKILAVIDE